MTLEKCRLFDPYQKIPDCDGWKKVDLDLLNMEITNDETVKLVRNHCLLCFKDYYGKVW